MNKTIKKLLSLTLALMMALSLLPTMANAAPALTYIVRLTQMDSTNNTPLDGAKFELWQVNSPSDILLTDFVPGSTDECFSLAHDGPKPPVSLITANGGQLIIGGLLAGEYYLKEISAPRNYTLPEGVAAKVYFTVGEVDFTATANHDAYGTVSVTDEPVGEPRNTYGPRLPVYPKYLQHPDPAIGVLSHSDTYISSFARTGDGIFYYNNGIDFFFS